MKKKHKITLLVIGIFLTISLMISLSYAYYIFSVSQSGSNVVRSDCFKITFSDGNAIDLNNTIPLSDDDAKELSPYTFTIKNICNSVMEYNVNIETLNTSTIDLNAIATKIDNKSKKILGTLDSNDSSLIVNNNISSSKTIYTDILKANQEKTHNLRLWVDYDATLAQSANKTFSSKVVINSKLIPNYKEATLIGGNTLNAKMKQQAGYSGAWIWTEDKRIKYIKRSTTSPLEENNAIDVSDSTSEVPIYMWYDTNTIYFYSDAKTIYLAANNEGLFQRLEALESIDLSMFDTLKATSLRQLFYESITIEELDLSNFDTSNVTTMNGMFYNNKNLTSIDLSSFDTSKVTDMGMMFSRLEKIEKIDLSNFDTYNVTNMEGMFDATKSLKEIKFGNNFNTSNVKNMSRMFQEMDIENIDLSNFNTSKVTNMSNMFYKATGLKSLDVSSFNTSKVTSMESMFNMYNDKITTLDISSFETSNVRNINNMFSNNSNLNKIYVSDKFVTSAVTSEDNVFENSTSLVGGAGTTYDANHIDKTYARVDDPTNGNPGYFTLKTT